MIRSLFILPWSKQHWSMEALRKEWFLRNGLFYGICQSHSQKPPEEIGCFWIAA